ncbi:saccharopine dehydrogenase [Streptomyces sp. WAC 06738]|uniref:saccharopine dehydrogenase family protein n=1 Tax=Streptomyces sp. WAC 06738 TaxID=2203210 RepID=UPI000F6F8501|nr:saccharopine dehydrogenase NADP-binding domain-containing protein [Streptomyces sp. WAC 06738]AZM50130.1 saccharopine dehydrogenase [Streptomyces sp. WAC 06738]
MADEHRPHDLILFGATGFTGGLTAEYLARHAPAGCRWALAGRDTGRLAEVRDRVAAIRPEWGDLPLLTADAADPAALRGLAERTRVVATAVGPFLRHGEPLAAACAAAGTDYADLTGEPEFVDRVYVRHHERARETGARLVHACGFECTPFDLGVRFTVEQLPEDVPLRIDGFLRAAGGLSGGTLASALGVVSRPLPGARAARARRRMEPRVTERRVRAPLGAPTRSGAVRAWGLPLPTLESRVVARSAAALPRYGPDFRYRHYAAVRRLPVAAGSVLGAGAFAAAAQLPPLRKLMASRLAPGTGPVEERRARSWFSARFVGTGGGRRVVTEVSGGDPGYDESAKMLAEAAMCLAYDPLPETSGQVTTAQAMGEALTARLVTAGMGFRVWVASP